MEILKPENRGALIYFGILLLCFLITVGTLLYVEHKLYHPNQEQTKLEEQQRQLIANTDSLYRVAYHAGEVKSLARIKALQADSAAAAIKDKRNTEKAQQSAGKYRKTPTLANCDTALTDCVAETRTKKAVIASRDKMLLAKDSTITRKGKEVTRSYAVNDSLSKGWKAANDKTTELLKPRLKVYATAAFEKHPINNNIKAGGTGTYDQWLFGYQAGILQPTHEIKAGILLRFKK